MTKWFNPLKWYAILISQEFCDILIINLTQIIHEVFFSEHKVGNQVVTCTAFSRSSEEYIP